ncbi:MAG: aldose 1-epimerase family protein [Limosilactobacillus sp.]|jgi:galactose mutarotase-like enzyme|uniref:aldose 1-epimerase family protein n=1 Tax=Limosilactobacillus sp. TaxID=2773925 RepID=UPI0025C60662|nr:aldose 1-epimerase family protein [Limosilactobacillus sp.]MCI1975048.1 aldose 1-epimerase family protein [Limosilactobacillus sp.]MCI2030997.1 aldose 1-epimerase family protein [Limosilactobacillus sp.]
MIKLENDKLTVEIAELGAQLHSIRRNDNQIEYLWQGDPDSWKRQAPILFPFVGRLKDDQYKFAGKTYHQTQHGFARDREFKVVDQSSSRVILEQTDSEDTLKVFPFAFQLQVIYELAGDQLNVCYSVTNPDKGHSLIYAIGAHPGFNMPLSNQGTFDQVQLNVSPAEKYSRIVLNGPYNDSQNPVMIDMQKPLTINHELFKNDAVIFETGGAKFTATLTDPSNNHGVHVHTLGTQHVGVWSPYPAKANLVCVEPWWGIADNVNTDGELLHKQGMHRLAPQDNDKYNFSIQPF